MGVYIRVGERAGGGLRVLGRAEQTRTAHN